jgi:integrase
VALRCHLKPEFGALLLCDIDANRIAAYQAHRKVRNASARTLNKELQVLRQILKRYKLWANIQGDVRFERESDNVGKAITEQEESQLLAACDSNLLLRTVVSLALNTALRKNEIRTLRWRQIDLIQRTLTVGRAKTEGGSNRLIPLNSLAYNSLHPADGERMLMLDGDCHSHSHIRRLSGGIARILGSLYLEERPRGRGWLIDCRFRTRLCRRSRFIVSLDLLALVHSSPAFPANSVAIARHCGSACRRRHKAVPKRTALAGFALATREVIAVRGAGEWLRP